MCSIARRRRSLPVRFDAAGYQNGRALTANPARSKRIAKRMFGVGSLNVLLLSGALRASCAEMKPHFECISAALHPPELNWHLTKSRLNDAPPLCEMQRRKFCLARHQEDKVDFSWARVDE
jgi:hypothetical protein